MKVVRLVSMLARGKLFKISSKLAGGKGLRVAKNLHVYNDCGGTFEIGERVKLYRNVGLYLHTPKSIIKIGDDTYVNHRTELRCYEKLSIGENCAISWDVTITDTDYHSINNKNSVKPVFIEDKVWIGCKSVILKGVTIGEGAVVAAGSIVTKDVPARALVAGNPAKVIKNNVSWM